MYKYWPSLAAPKLVTAVDIGGYRPPSSVSCVASSVLDSGLFSAGFASAEALGVAIDAPGGLAVAQAAIANVAHGHEARAARVSILLLVS
jgi:hypothetical protein